MANELEKDIKNAILAWLSYQRNCMVFVHDSVGIFDPIKKIHRRRTSRFHRPGVADILGIVNKMPLAIEVKTKKGVLTDHQKQFLAQWEQMGGISIVARSVDDVINHPAFRSKPAVAQSTDTQDTKK